MSELKWLPIETAPKDGTDIIVMYKYADAHCVFNAYYSNEEGQEGWWSYVFTEISRYKLDDYMTPTHWIPLPE